MSCDIYAYAERRSEDGSFELVSNARPFNFQNYALFGWLAGVRNYAGLTVISAPRSLPCDASDAVRAEFDHLSSDAHDASWLAIDELLKFSYEQPAEDRRVMRELAPEVFDRGCTAPPGQGTMTTYRRLFTDDFFDSPAMLKATSSHRVVFWFVG